MLNVYLGVVNQKFEPSKMPCTKLSLLTFSIQNNENYKSWPKLIVDRLYLHFVLKVKKADANETEEIWVTKFLPTCNILNPQKDNLK